MHPEIEKFYLERGQNIKRLSANPKASKDAINFIVDTAPEKYSYNFTWMGIPIIQFPQDMVAMQEIIWQVKPDLIIETGVAHGGSLVFSASMLELLGGKRHVIGIDIDIRSHNRVEIEKHPMSKRISLVQGSSIDAGTVAQVRKLAEGYSNVLVFLDSNHTHDHVLKELECYSPFVTPGSYLVVFDTVIEDMPADFYPDRPWGKGNNPKTAVHEFLRGNKDFVIDESIPQKILITVAPDGYLKRVHA